MSSLNTIDFGVDASPKLQAALKNFSAEKQAKLLEWHIPTRKTEAWKYSSKRLGMSSSDVGNLEANKTTASNDPTAKVYTEAYSLDCNTLIISNGKLEQKLPLIEGLSIQSFADLNDNQSKDVASGAIASSDNLMFADLNAAFLQNGVFIELADNQHIDKPLKIVFHHIGESNSFPRVFIKLGKNSSMTIVEESSTHSGLSATDIISKQNAAILNSVTDIHVSANAKLTFLKMNLDDDACRHIASTGVALMRDARIHTYCLSLGNQLNRHDLLVKMMEAGAECDLNGICVTTDKQHVDCHTCIEHIAPNCTSNESYRCIADKKSQIVFNGRIHIHKDAQKTLGSMSNKNLLLSSEAEIDSKPELEIYADDVKCGHGTTIGQLDEAELYYLKTRGINHEQAKLMLTLGFVLEIVRAAPVIEIAEYWEQTLASILSYKI
ncbi:MAG: Fe-S cluster assembly protein SufD [Oleiphilaceae bacterium]|jgi:Fe-S cluster assembly protein SufD